MTKNQFGEKNHQWKGGRVIASNGYVLVRVGAGHHLADVRGYAYEHRLVAEQKLGRRLEPGEMVHHKDENKQNNHPDNLLVVTGNAEHFFHHRKRTNLQLPGEPNPSVACECGCGETFPRFDDSGRPRRFISGHNATGTGLPGDLLWYIRNVPESTRSQFMAEFLGMDHRKVIVALSKMKSRGLVSKVGNEWRIVA